eukprot:gene17463-biopygen9870
MSGGTVPAPVRATTACVIPILVPQGNQRAVRCSAAQCSTLPCHATQCSAVQAQRNAVPCSAVPCGAVPCCVQCGAVQCSAVPFSAVQCSAVKRSAPPCRVVPSAVQCSAAQNSKVPCGEVQCRAVLCSAAQCSMVRCRTERCCTTLNYTAVCDELGPCYRGCQEHQQYLPLWEVLNSMNGHLARAGEVAPRAAALKDPWLRRRAGRAPGWQRRAPSAKNDWRGRGRDPRRARLFAAWAGGNREQDGGADVARAWRGRGAGYKLQFGMSGTGVARAWCGRGVDISCSPSGGWARRARGESLGEEWQRSHVHRMLTCTCTTFHCFSSVMLDDRIVCALPLWCHTCIYFRWFSPRQVPSGQKCLECQTHFGSLFKTCQTRFGTL